MRYLPPDLPAVELGAGLGFVSCLANRRLGKPERHVCVEANPVVLPFLHRNRDRNRCRFIIRHGALAYDAPEVQLGVDEYVSRSSIGDDTKPLVTVPTTSLAGVLGENGFDRVSVICDIEGAEQALFAREGVLLREGVQTLILEVHPQLYGPSGVEELEAASGALGFQRVWSKENVWVLHNSGLQARRQLGSGPLESLRAK
jgi:FkbM family methyltransferase